MAIVVAYGGEVHINEIMFFGGAYKTSHWVLNQVHAQAPDCLQF